MSIKRLHIPDTKKADPEAVRLWRKGSTQKSIPLYNVADSLSGQHKENHPVEWLHLNFLRNLKMEIPKNTNLTVSYGLGYPRITFG